MNSPGSLRLVLTGDSMITRGVATGGPDQARKLVELIRGGDVAFTNLEMLPNDFKGYPAAGTQSGGTHLAAHSWVIDELVDMGIDLFACASNHSLDFGIEGLLATMEQLEERRLAFAGIGRTLAGARMPVYMDRGPGSVALLSCVSTFYSEQAAGEQRPDFRGRPGVNPLRFNTVYEVRPEQLKMLKEIASELGLDQQRREFVRMGFKFPPEDPEVFPFADTNLRAAGLLDAKFRAAGAPAVRTSPAEQDLEEVAKWTREAKARADVVLVSLHAHEQGTSVEIPAEFNRTFAHRIIDEGADVVVGHGPHLLRGAEIYRGKPIFYSLGNFFAQDDLVYKFPADSYEKLRVAPSETPGGVVRALHRYDREGYATDERLWQTVVPILDFAGDRLERIQVVPVTLAPEESAPRRGKPRLAEGEAAENILRKFADLCEELGTRTIPQGDHAALGLETKEV